MSRARNIVVILILCIIGGYSMMKKNGPILTMPAADELRDTVAGGPTTKASRPGLNFGQTNDGELRDAVANNAAENGGNGPIFGNSDGGNPPPPRGSGTGGFGPLGNGGPGQNLPPNDPPEDLSPSAPPSDEKPICVRDYDECYSPQP
ncbi:MAG: hypothetical protein SF051_07625 [Elusimicrobiota bacterium]|nr:hypothetical protein [Elusimicrobiota bacterium]